jgi:hypothetical protein
MFSASVHAGAFLMDGLPAIHLCLLLKAMNRTQRLGLKLRVEEEAENLGINVQSHGEKKAYAEWVSLLDSYQNDISAAFDVSRAFYQPSFKRL